MDFDDDVPPAGGGAGPEDGGPAGPTTAAAVGSSAAPPPRRYKPWEKEPGSAPPSASPPAAGSQPASAAPQTQQAPAAQPLREDQIQNAVAFLSHPKVVSSSAESKRAFLQKKGLTAPEIDEAFRRVPQGAAPPAAAPAAPAPAPAPAPAAPAVPQQLAAANAPPDQQQPVRWSQVILGAGTVGLAAYAARTLLEPFRYQALHSLSRAVAPREDLQKEQEQQAKLKETEEVLQSTLAAMGERTAELTASVEALARRMDEPRPEDEAARRSKAAIEATVTELQGDVRGLAWALQRQQEAPKVQPPPPPAVDANKEVAELKKQLADLQATMAEEMAKASAKAAADAATAAAAAAAAATQQQQQQPKVFAPEPAAMPKEELKKPEPEQTVPAPETTPASSQEQAPVPIPAGAAPAPTPEKEAPALAPQADAKGKAPMVQPEPPQDSPGPESGKPSVAYKEVIQMLQEGKMPPNVRTDIRDSPPNPSQPPSQPQASIRRKPWEQAGSPSAGGSSWMSSLMPQQPNGKGNGEASSLFPGMNGGVCSSPQRFWEQPAVSGGSNGASLDSKVDALRSLASAERAAATTRGVVDEVAAFEALQRGFDFASAEIGASGGSSAASPAAVAWTPPAPPKPSISMAAAAPASPAVKIEELPQASGTSSGNPSSPPSYHVAVADSD